MDDGRSEILAGIQKLRTKATQRLAGNEYYMVVQQLDTIASSPELTGDLALAFLGLIESRLNAGPLTGKPSPMAAGTAKDTASPHPVSVAGSNGPEVPSPGDTPAEPESPSPEEPSTPDSPAQPEPSPGVDIPAPPGSPAEPSTPPEMRGGGVANPGEDLLSPRANSFGIPQPTSAIGLHVETEGIAESQTAVEAASQTSLSLAANAARRLINQRLSGNAYYSAANLLAALRDLPQSAVSGDAISQPSDAKAALALLRGQASALSGPAQEEATKLIASLERILAPAPEARTKAVAADEDASGEAAAPVHTDLSSAPDPEPDPGPQTGFDNLAAASWRRVKEADRSDRGPASGLNGGTPPASVVAGAAAAEPPAQTSPAEAPAMAEPATSAAPAAAEPMSADKGEALADGGPERRSSEPCYAGEFEPDSAPASLSGDHEPAGETQAGQATEARGEASLSPEAEALADAPKAVTSATDMVNEAGGAAVMTSAEAVSEPDVSEAVAQEQMLGTNLLEEAQAAIESAATELVEKTDDAIAAVLDVSASEPVTGDRATSGQTKSEPEAEQTSSDSVTGEPAPAAQSAAARVPDAAITDQPGSGEAKSEKVPKEPAKAGFLRRLFGLRSAEHR